MLRKLLSTAALGVLAGTAMAADVSIGISIGTPPPPPRVVYYAPPPAPGPEYLWVDGYWYPEGPRYVWRAGYWARPPYEGAFWVAPHYESGRYFVGRWERHDNGLHKGWDRGKGHGRGHDRD